MTATHHDGRYAIDIRVFLTIIALTMAASFIAGVTMVPADVSTPTATPVTVGVMPEVHSSLLNVSTEIPTEDQHHPSGQHLLVDIRNVDGAFLNSEERLSKALVDTVKEAG